MTGEDERVERVDVDPRLPWDDAPAGEPAADQPAAEESALDEAMLDVAVADDEPAPDQPAADQPAADQPALDEAMPDDAGAYDEPVPDEPAADQPAPHEATAGGAPSALDVPGGPEPPPSTVQAVPVGPEPPPSTVQAVPVGPGRPAPPPPTPATPSAASLSEARLARVHLRVGMFGLARAELETLAARGALDVPALADLAEVRWRTGDLVGAGEAADAYLEAGGDELVAVCVAAEAAAAAGRMADARNLAARVLARGRDRLDDLFAGQPQSNIWPAELRPGNPSLGRPESTPGIAPPPAGAPAAALHGSGDLADVEARLARGDLAGTATRLALLLRRRPALAPAVLAMADEALRMVSPGAEAASIHLVRGDAYRLMGRETLAAEAFQQASRALHGVREPEETS